MGRAAAEASARASMLPHIVQDQKAILLLQGLSLNLLQVSPLEALYLYVQMIL